MHLRVLRAAAFLFVFLMSFRLFAGAPTATTVAATMITASSASLNGTGVPNSENTIGWFRISATNPGTCDDTFGTRIPAQVDTGTNLGNGVNPVPYSIVATGLTSGVTYYFCAIVSNASGKAFGGILSFTVPGAPVVVTNAVTLLASTTVTLQGSANPNAAQATGWFRYDPVNPGTCNDSFGTRAPTGSGGTSLGLGTSPVDYSRAITSLVPGTTYYYCAIASNAHGTSFGDVMSFTTNPVLPIVTTNNATLITGTGAQLNGSANPGGAATTGWYRYSPTNPGTCDDSFGTRAPNMGGSSLGSGNTAQSYGVGVSGLTPATTYYFCAIAENSVGKAFGSVLSFTTPAPPSVTTTGVTNIQNTSATLQGSGIPNGAASIGYFRYSLTNPMTCDDVFGSRAPTTPGTGTNLGAGTISQSFSQAITGLSAGTTYYFCAIASNAEGTSFGAIQSFVTAAAPTAASAAATAITSSGATLNGSGDPNGASATGYFRYSTANPGSCSDSFGTRTTTPDASLGSGTLSVDYSKAIAGLIPATTYYYCAIVTNNYGTAFGALLQFTTLANPPSVTTNNATLLTGATAQLNGTVNPGGATTTAWFRVAPASPGTCNDSFGTRVPMGTGGSAVGSGNGGVSYNQSASMLTAGQTYYFCAIAENSVGKTFGSVLQFTTPTPPTVTTGGATSITNNSATLAGTGTPNGSQTTGHFRYSSTDPGTCNDMFGSRAPAVGGDNLGSGTNPQSYSEGISGLSAGTTYYYCAIVTSNEGIAFGSIQSFTTAAAPLATTGMASAITSNNATLNGSGDPNGGSASGYFRYSPVNPGTCSDGFGTRIPSSTFSDQGLGAGTVAVPYSFSTGTLLPGTTYYFCAIVYNNHGTSYGAIESFTTNPTLPTVTTNNASMLTSSGAQLNGTSNPGGAATTGWFRYATVSPGTCNDSFGTRAPNMGGSSLGAGTSNTSFNQAITGLSAATTYFYCAIAESSVGKVFGNIASFTTPTPPTVTTGSVSSVGNTSATLLGTVNANGSATVAWFRYSLAEPEECDDSFGSRAPITPGTGTNHSGTNTQNTSQNISGLSAGTTYYYCVIASSAEGISFGAIQSFTTAAVPATTTVAASGITPTTATINGTSDPNLGEGYGYFRYQTSNPGLCNDLFGIRVPSTSSQDTYLGNGTAAVPYSRGLTGLTPATTYWYCALGRNQYGTTVGSVMSFTTQANLPAVTTQSVTNLGGTGAQLNGTANPGGASTTGWFRYASASPGTCNDSFGTRAPMAPGGTALGSGNTSQSFNQVISGLTPGSTYYYCAIAENATGLGFGAIQQFTTPLPPVVATTGASNVQIDSATLEGVAIPNGAATIGYFRYSTTDPGACDDVFGSRAPPGTGGSNLGTGSGTQNFAQTASGLSGGTTYYYCAIASSAEGKAYGAILSFTTPNVPTTTTAAATAVTSSTATLNGTSNPNGSSTTGWFRYSTVSPGTCSDSFGSRTSSPDASVGSGTSAVSYSRNISGLSPATTYYYCAISQNQFGKTFGALMQLTTLANAPTVTTNNASLLTGTSAQLNATVNPGGAAATGWFRYATVSPGTCNDSFGTRVPGGTGGSALGSGITNTTYFQPATMLTPGTTYFFCAIAENSVGKSFGNVVQFTTPLPPAVTTNGVSSLTSTTVQLNGSGNPNGSASIGYFRYSLVDPVTCDDVFGSRAPAGTGGTNLGSGTSNANFSQSVTGLSPGTTYFYCAIASSAEGKAYGEILSFTTPTVPGATTSPATLITSTSAQLNGAGDPNGDLGRGYFRYGTTNPGVCSDSYGTRLPASSSSDANLGTGTADVAYSFNLGGLQPGTTYYYCAAVRNGYGTTFGAVLSFTTLSTAPTLSTNSATLITTSSATLNGTANPHGSATTGWFRYAPSSPGSCNDSFGTRAPATGGSSLGAGTSSTSFSQPITGLSPGTTYYFCAIAENGVGITFGTVLQFTTTAPPTVATLAATPVTATTATLNGVVTPNGFTTTGHFRYSTTDPGTCDQSFGTATANQSLGSSSSPQNMAQPLTGLAPATTYYFCAIATSSIGTTLGAVLSFTTPAAPPGVTTVAASAVLNTTATLNATVNPNGGDSTAWFRYATTNPVTCNDSFGTRAPSMGGTELGSGNTPVNVAMPIAMLTAGTTYYFCVLASSSVGTSVGTVLSFTTANTPAVTTNAATSITSTGATINGTANPNQSATSGWFRYDTTNPVTCNDNFGTRAPSSGGTSLGAGGTAQSFNQPLTGLTSATTYYYCAIAENAIGKSFGNVLSFTTAATPVVTTLAATSITGTAATLNATANPNLLTSQGWFRYSTTNPVTCNDSFGTRIPSANGVALGSSGTAQPYSQSVTTLSPSTTYYYCALASNSAGTGFGAVMSFTTAGPPIVTSSAATLVTNNSATLNGAANPNLANATGYFRYSTTNPVTCNDGFGTRAPSSGGASLGAGSTAVAYSQAITGLAAGTTYYFCAIASNAAGTGVGSVLTFTTLAAPTATSSAATLVTSTTATLNGSGNPRLDAATGYFRYSPTNPGSCNDMFGTRAPASGGTSLGSGNTAVSFSEPITDLTPGTTYYFCALAQNSIGTGLGSVLSFTTTAAPVVTTSAASAIASTTATLNGTANPKLAATTAWFRFATTNPGTCDDTFGTRAPASGGSSIGSGNSALSYSQPATGLTSATTYYYCAIAENAVGKSFGAVQSFTTAAAPSVTTLAATNVTTTAATLNGSGNPNFLSTVGHFRYSATQPASCTDSFGTRAPSSGGANLMSGGSPVAYVQNISGLLSGTTYYYCAIAINSAGTGFGAVMSFTTAGTPSVTTVSATAITSTTATLEGSANPKLLSASGFFRYSLTQPASCNNSFGTRAPSSGGSPLGNGNAPVDYSQPITGLTPGSTYYYCALADNSAGVGLGTIMSFTTLAAPIVTTSAATALTSSGATLNGTANPKLSDATGWFRYSTTNPVTCDDNFGTRAPASGGTALGAGNAALPYSEQVEDLLSGTTYYYCAIAQNSVGTSFGSVQSFTTTNAPVVTTLAASALTATGATLNGQANPKLVATTGWFRYDTVDPGTCDDTFGTRAPTTGGVSLGAGNSPIVYAQAITGLTASTTYYYCAIAENSVGKSFGAVMSFSTLAAPAVTTVAATSITGTGATLNGTGTPNGAATTGWFRYSTTQPATCNDSFGTRAPAAGGTSLGAGSTPVPWSQAVTGLTLGTTYYFCAIAQNSVGTSFGQLLSFTTPAAPAVTSLAATDVTSTGAELNGSADPNLADATGWFRYSTTQPASCNDVFGTRAPASGGAALGAGTDPVDYAQALTGLMPGTTYYFCAIAQNSVGTSFGQVLSFTTLAPPAVTTVAASAVTSTTATLNGSANPKLSDATGWFRYGETDPGTCNDSFGTRVPANGGTDLGAGNAAVPYSEPLADLTPGTKYYYCAIAESAIGPGFGQVLSFTTLAPPDVTTLPPTAVLSGGAILQASGNPNQSATTGWFRYDTVDPGTCDDTFGTRTPAAGGDVLGAGTMPVPYSQPAAGLMPLTTYYFCAIAENAVGKGFGEILTFTTSGAPAVTTEDATDVTADDAVVNGTVNPNMAQSTGWFRYSKTDPGTCNDNFGTRVPANGGTVVPAGTTAVAFDEPITALEAGTTYYFCAIAENEGGKSFGEVLTLTTEADAPTVATNPATVVQAESAKLNGSANPHGDAATGWFRFDTTSPGTCNDSFGTRVPAAGGTALGDGTAPVGFTETLTELKPGTKYFFCAIAENSKGIAFGTILQFTTGAAPPVVTTEEATDVKETAARIAGTALPNGSDTTGWFRLGETDPGASCDDSYGVRVPETGGVDLGAGADVVPFDQQLTKLKPGVTYYFCAAAGNMAGAVFGEVLTFTTEVPPTVQTKDAAVDGGSVTLNGVANPNGTEGLGWFRFDTADPGECNDMFGTRAPQVEGTALGNGNEDVAFLAFVDLQPGDFYYCAIASNDAGISFGEVKTFHVSDGSGGGGGGGGDETGTDGGCGCRVSSDSSDSLAALSVVALLLAALRRRRRTGKPSSDRAA